MRLTIIDEIGLRTKDGKGLVRGLNNEWIEGEEIPCRKSLCSFEIVKENQVVKK